MNDSDFLELIALVLVLSPEKARETLKFCQDLQAFRPAQAQTEGALSKP